MPLKLRTHTLNVKINFASLGKVTRLRIIYTRGNASLTLNEVGFRRYADSYK